jgi:hypothetical protein
VLVPVPLADPPLVLVPVPLPVEPEPPREPEPAGTLATGGVVRVLLGVTVLVGVTARTAGVKGAGWLTATATVEVGWGVARLGAVERWEAARRSGAVFNPGVAGAGVTAMIPSRDSADRVAGTSVAWPAAGLVSVAAPTANATPNATIVAANINSSIRPNGRLEYSAAGTRMPFATECSLKVDPAITRSQVTRGLSLEFIIPPIWSSMTAGHARAAGALFIRGGAQSPEVG